MAVELTDDLRLSHAYLNALYAGLQGSYAAANVLGQLGYGELAPDTAADLRDALDFVGARTEAMWRGISALGRGEPSETAQTLLGMFEHHKGRLIDFIGPLIASLNVLQDEGDRESAAYVAAAVARHAYTRWHFIQGLVRYGESFGQEDVADRWRQHTPSCQRNVQEAHQLLARLQGLVTPDQAFYGEIWNTGANLPCVFKNQLVDLMEIEALRGAPVTFETLGIESAEAERWRALGMDASAAALWWACELTPQEAVAWMAACPGWDTTCIGAWKVRGFEPPAAAAWHAAGLPPDEAYAYRRAGVQEPGQAAALRAGRARRSD